MKDNTEARSRLALACYERAAAVMAGRAGAPFTPAPDDFSVLINAAQRLALPGQTEAENQLPALTSLAGHLHSNSAQGYYRPRPLAGNIDAVMPTKERPADLLADYRELWEQFASERQTLFAHANGAPAVQEVGYHALLQRLAWSMPAPGVGDSDVSLCDFARTSAALAVCLADGGPSEQQGRDAVALLLGGDVSGVQDWLYTIGSSGAAKSLRGRSVYLQLLSEVIALYLLDELGLPACNLLYVGGGNFYVLAPLSAVGDLERMQAEISRRLLAMHGGALYLALGWTEVARADLEGQQTGVVWNRANQKMGARKRKRFSELDDDDMERAIGKPLEGTGRLEDSCAICRRPIVPGEKTGRSDEDDPNNPARNCELCESFSELGSDLPKAKFLVIAKLPPSLEYRGGRIHNWLQGLATFGYNVQFLDAAKDQPNWHVVPASNLIRVHYRDADHLPALSSNLKLPATVQIYRPLAQAAPMQTVQGKGPIATFDDLKTEGIQRWGVLRMDVDNLGRIFQSGLGDSSLSRVVSLSAQMRLLFEGHIPQMMAEYNDAHPQSTYLMYAGGDDLFVVGGWSHLPELARKVRAALVQFAVENPHVTISGGISLALGEKYPIYQAARAAGRAEDMAKDAGKNRLALLGQAVPWESEDRCNYGQVRERVAQLQGWLGGKDGPGQLNRSFLMRLRAIDAEWREWRQEEARREREQEREWKRQANQQPAQPFVPLNERKHLAPRYVHVNKRLYLGPWQWHLVYGLSREAERVRDGEIKEAIKQLIDDIVAGEITVLGLEARWTELWTREKGESHD